MSIPEATNRQPILPIEDATENTAEVGKQPPSPYIVSIVLRRTPPETVVTNIAETTIYNLDCFEKEVLSGNEISVK